MLKCNLWNHQQMYVILHEQIYTNWEEFYLLSSEMECPSIAFSNLGTFTSDQNKAVVFLRAS